MDNKNENIIKFYVKANENKYKIAKEDINRDYSVAEVTVLACMDALFRHDIYADKDHDWDYNKVIRMILFDSLRGKLDDLEGKNKYNRLMNEIDDTSIEETQLARVSVFNTLMGFKDENEDLNNLLKKQLKLQRTIRKGHIYWGAKGDRLESILEHIYGTMIIAIGLESEYGHCIDYNKLLKMLLIHETEEIVIGDITEFDGVTPEEKIELGKKAVKEVFASLPNAKYYTDLLDEFNAHETIVSEYGHLDDKLEYDLQVKMYELQGRYDFENRPDNVVTRSSSVRKIIEDGANTVFDVHYEYDKHRFHDYPCLRRILEVARKM